MTKIKTILAGIDTLIVGYNINGYALGDSEWYMLAEAKEAAKAIDFNPDGQRIDFRGKLFSVLPTGTRMHKYILKNEDITLKIKPAANGGAAYPEIIVQYSSVFLWRGGYELACTQFRDWLSSWAYVSGEIVSRVDLCGDVNAPLPELDRDFRELVTRAQGKETFQIQTFARGLKLSGYVFGSGDCLCRVYDKVNEIETKSNKTWFYDLYRQNGWTDGEPVTRIEFQTRRKFLKSMQVTTLDDLLASIADLWVYLTEKWLSLRDQGNDSNRSRWAVKPYWAVVQGARRFFGKLSGVMRVRQYRPKLAALRQQARGVMVSMAAVVGASMGGNDSSSIGYQYVLQEFGRMLSEPFFKTDIKRREAKMAAFS
jgi:hypothetical protein